MTLIAASTSHSGLGSADMEMMLWNIVLSAAVAVMGFLFKGKIDELDRIGILLNKTREDVAREHVTRAEVNVMVDRLGDRFDKAFERLEVELCQHKLNSIKEKVQVRPRKPQPETLNLVPEAAPAPAQLHQGHRRN